MKTKRVRKPKRQQEDKNYIEVTGKIFSVVEYFIESGSKQRPVPFSDIASALPFARTTVHRILYSLERLGYVEKDKVSGHYLLAGKFFELTGPAIQFRRLQSVAKSVMQNLLLRFGETVNLGVLDDGQVAYIEVVQSPSALRIAAEAGERNPIHSTALGKAILAYLPEGEINAILEAHPLIKKTPKTITQKRHFLEHLASVREKGVALDMEENLSNVICVAAPIFDRTGRVVAGLSISGPASRMQPKLTQIQGETREAASAISHMLSPGALTATGNDPGGPLGSDSRAPNRHGRSPSQPSYIS